jgi:pimeloyl-ACP methyl ester carboxylesterase
MKPVAIQMAIANVDPSVDPLDVYNFIEAETDDVETYVPARSYRHIKHPELVGDIVGLVNALGSECAIVVGHDWGARVAWNCALMRPDLFRGLGLLEDPYMPRGPVRPAVLFEQITRARISIKLISKSRAG